jgi:polyferredoxin
VRLLLVTLLDSTILLLLVVLLGVDVVLLLQVGLFARVRVGVLGGGGAYTEVVAFGECNLERQSVTCILGAGG